jgi:hypothetical protein
MPTPRHLPVDQFFAKLDSKKEGLEQGSVSAEARLQALKVEMGKFVDEHVRPLFEKYQSLLDKRGWDVAVRFGADMPGASFTLFYNNSGGGRENALSFHYDYERRAYDLTVRNGRYPGSAGKWTIDTIEEELQRFIENHWFYGHEHFEAKNNGGVRMKRQ